MKIIELKDIQLIDKMLKPFIDRKNFDQDQEIDMEVEKIINEIRSNGDKGLISLTKEFDNVDLEDIRVSEGEIEDSTNQVEKEFLEILKQAQDNIELFHNKQLQLSWFFNKGQGITLGQKVTPIDRIGIYVPGGKAAYPSTVLMNAIPARVAGVKSIAMATPPSQKGKVSPYILAAAKMAGIGEIYKVGGAQSIAAFAFGTETIKPVNKIVGPGNIYVARAKRRVFGHVDIDMVAGPSEICVIADNKANPRLIAADLLSQAEHDELASSILITPSSFIAEEVNKEVEIQLNKLKRKDIAKKSIEDYGLIIVVNTLDEAFEISNEIAPEHLEVMLENSFDYLAKIKNAGAIFLGQYSPEPLGDYFAGPNHTLPTGGTAKFSSPLGVDDFIKKSNIIHYNKKELEQVKDQIIYFADKEGLEGHGNSMKERF